MNPIVLIHGYSAESSGTKPADITGIYGDLPQRLEQKYPEEVVVEINLSRYISLDDGVTVEDIADALDRVLHSPDFGHLMKGRFNVIIHSTGALVVRMWILRCSPKPSPIERVIYLAGANFGSGWAHIGRGQLAKWAREVFENGAERGVEVLSALELGSSPTVELHRQFLAAGDQMVLNFDVREALMIGTQAHPAWYEIPIRYAKEDGSDGVVRTCATNLNFNYVRYVARNPARTMDWPSVLQQEQQHLAREEDRQVLYEPVDVSKPGLNGRPLIPFAIVDQCAHSGKETGIVSGEAPRDQVMRLIDAALTTSPERWENLVKYFDKETTVTYGAAAQRGPSITWLRWITNPRGQYDAHAQVIFRLRDQYGRPVNHYDVFFDSVGDGKPDDSRPMRDLIEDKHVNSDSANIITFYVRVVGWADDTKTWVPLVPQTHGCHVEIAAVQPDTEEVKYLPFRMDFEEEELTEWLEPHRTTIIDVELYRVGSPDIYRMARVP